VETKKGFLVFSAVVNAKALPTIVASVSLQAIACSILSCVNTETRFAGNSVASRSVFFGVNMFKVEKVARTSYKLPFFDTRNRTLSGSSAAKFFSTTIDMPYPSI